MHLPKAYGARDLERQFVALTAEDFKNADVEATQSIEILGFVEAAEIDPVYFDRPHYLAPVPRSEKGYVLLREALRRTRKTGVARIVIHAKEHVAALRVHESAVALHTFPCSSPGPSLKH